MRLRARFRRRGEGEDELEGERDRMIMLNFALGHSLTMRLSKGGKQRRLYKRFFFLHKFRCDEPYKGQIPSLSRLVSSFDPLVTHSSFYSHLLIPKSNFFFLFQASLDLA